MNTHVKPPAQNIPVDDFPIEDGIPVPNKNRATKYPFKQMKVGQSFFVAEEVSPAKNVRASISNFKKANAGWDYSAAAVDKPVKGLRVWCTSLPKEEGNAS